MWRLEPERSPVRRKRAMQQLLSSLEDERQRQFRRFVAISAVTHVVLLVVFWIGPISHRRSSLPVVERVELVEVVASAPVARPAPTPAPAPPPPPKPPPEVKKVLPKEPPPPPKPKPVEAKPKPKPKPEPKVEPKPEEPPPEQKYEDVLADLRKAAGETAPSPVVQEEAPPAAAQAGPSGGPGILDPELARWRREVKIHVTRAWIVPAGFRTEALITDVEVELSATGDVLGTRVLKRSGNPWYDESVERAIEKASPLPAPPRSGEYELEFDSREM